MYLNSLQFCIHASSQLRAEGLLSLRLPIVRTTMILRSPMGPAESCSAAARKVREGEFLFTIGEAASLPLRGGYGFCGGFESSEQVCRALL